MRINRALAVAGWAVAAAGGAGLGWVLLTRAVALPEVDRWVGLALAAGAVLAVAAGAVVRIPPVLAAWAADRWLGTQDRYATAVELIGLTERPSGLAADQVAEAEEAAAGVRRWPSRPRVPLRLLVCGGAAAGLAFGVAALPNPQDQVRTVRASEREAVATQAHALRAAAEELGAPELALSLDQLAGELERSSVERALERLDGARATLAGLTDPAAAAQRTALTGLARELTSHPLGPEGGVQQQFQGLAEQLEQGVVAADQALSGRLRQLSDALSGAPEVADALSSAAAAAAQGDAASAAQALRDAAAAVDRAASELAEQDAVASADAALAASQAALRDDAGGAPLGGINDSGVRSGRGVAADPALQGLGRGQQEASDLDLQTVYDPPERLGGPHEALPLEGTPGAGPSSEVSGTTSQGQGLRNTPLVPYLEVLADYAEEAAHTIERPGYPVRLRGTVQGYFDRIGAGI